MPSLFPFKTQDARWNLSKTPPRTARNMQWLPTITQVDFWRYVVEIESFLVCRRFLVRILLTVNDVDGTYVCTVCTIAYITTYHIFDATRVFCTYRSRFDQRDRYKIVSMYVFSKYRATRVRTRFANAFANDFCNNTPVHCAVTTVDFPSCAGGPLKLSSQVMCCDVLHFSCWSVLVKHLWLFCWSFHLQRFFRRCQTIQVAAEMGTTCGSNYLAVKAVERVGQHIIWATRTAAMR